MCAVTMAGGTRAQIAGDVDEATQGLGVAAATGCALYCPLPAEAVCSEATTTLLGFIAQRSAADDGRRRLGS